MSIRIGTIFTGEVEKIGEQSIQTKFFMIGVPLIPLESFFVLRDRGNGVEGFGIPLHGKSVLLGYARWGAFIAAVIGGIMALVTPSYRRGPADFVFAAIALSVWVFVAFIAGKPARATLEQRKVLLATTGVSALPAMLPGPIAEKVLAALNENPLPDNVAWRFASSLYEAHLQASDAAQRRADEAWATLAGVDAAAAARGPGRLIADNENR